MDGRRIERIEKVDHSSKPKEQQGRGKILGARPPAAIGAKTIGETMGVIDRAASEGTTTASFMDRLTEADRQALIATTHFQRYRPGDVICRQGDVGDMLYVVVRGRVAVLKEILGGSKRSGAILLGYRGPGEILGEMSLVGSQERSASLVAVEDSELLCMEATRFSALMARQPAISWAVLSVLNDRLQEADAARTSIVQEEQDLAQQVVDLTSETERLAELARTRQETIELLVHDLRTPVAVIDGCLQMMETSLPPDALAPVEKILALADRSAARLMQLLEELLSAARQEGTLATLVREPFDLRRMLREAVESAEATARGAKLTLSLELPEQASGEESEDAGLSAMGDRAQLRRVVDNLVENAMSYTPGGGRIVVAAALADDEIQVSVTDTGPGVPEEHRELIFERFTRVPGIEGRRQGFGLGLYFCRQVIEAHGGRIWMEPGPGGLGSCFIFTLPLQQEG